jgi:hypothetical protein
VDLANLVYPVVIDVANKALDRTRYRASVSFDVVNDGCCDCFRPSPATREGQVVAGLARNQMSPWYAQLAIVNGRLVLDTGLTGHSYMRVL